MRAANSSAIAYAPAPIPSDVESLNRYLLDELIKIQAAISGLASGHLDKSYAAPTKPRAGDIRYADGTTWNPGSGEGVYYYNGTIWKLLG